MDYMDYNITYRDKDGGIQYIISYKDHEGKWRQKSKQGFKGKREAKRAADKRLEELKKTWTLRPDPEYEGITFGEFAKMYLKHVTLYKEGNTAKGYKTTVRRFSDLNDISLSKITSLHVQNCVDQMVKDGLKTSTLQGYLTQLSAIFENAIKPREIITDNPVADIVVPRAKKVKGESGEKIRALTRAQLDKLLSSLKNRKYYTISLIAAKTGLRIGEIIGLTWADVDFSKGTISVNKQWKLLKDRSWGFGSVKSVKSNRLVPVPPSLLAELELYKKETPTSIDRRIIPYAITQTASRCLKDAYSRSGFNISVHDLRHTYATLLLADGVDFETVAKLLGHDVKETIATYSHVTSDMMSRARQAVNDIFC